MLVLTTEAQAFSDIQEALQKADELEVRLPLNDEAYDIGRWEDHEQKSIRYFTHAGGQFIMLPPCSEVTILNKRHDLWRTKDGGGERVPNTGRELILRIKK